MDKGQGWQPGKKKSPTCNKGSEACTALGKHLHVAPGAKWGPTEGWCPHIVTGEVGNSLFCVWASLLCKGTPSVCPSIQTHTCTQSLLVRLCISREKEGISVKVKVQGEAVALCSGWVRATCDKRDSLAPWPHHSLLLAVREGNTEEQSRKGCWAINRFYTSAYTQLGNTAWWLLVEIKSTSVCGKIYCNTCNIFIWQWRHHTYLVWKMCFFPQNYSITYRSMECLTN